MTLAKAPVLIVGAGPVGLTMAIELTRYGVPVRIIDKSAARTDKSRALVLWSRSLELLNASGCTESLVAAGNKVTSANILANNKMIAHITLDGVETPYPYALMLPQSETERILEEHLAKIGVKVERSTELTSFFSEGDTVDAVLRRTNVGQESLQTPWLLGCDGAHSAVRHQLGLQFEGDTLPSDWALADVRLHGPDVPKDLTIAWHAQGVLGLFPIAGDRYRVLADVSPEGGGGPLADPTLSSINQLLQERGPGGITATDPVWLATFHINERKVQNYRSGRCFLAGDAAHIHSPAGGQGMNTGMQDACNLAWKLAMVWRGCGSPELLLNSYSDERSAVGEKVLRDAGRLTSAAILHGSLEQSLRNHVVQLLFGFATIREKVAEVLTEVAIAYPDGALTVERGCHSGPHAGARAPIFQGSQQPETAADQVVEGPKFTLHAPPTQEAQSLIRQFPGMLRSTPGPALGDRGFWIVRPDGYVGLAAGDSGWAAAVEYLSRITAAPASV